MKSWITGIGWVTAAGFGQGKSAGEQPFCPGQLEIPKRKQVFEKPDMRFGRLDEFSRIGLAAIAFSLRDAGREEWEQKRPIGIVAASRYGCLQTDLSYLQTMLPEQGKLASPNLFAYTLPNCFLGEAALRFGLVGSSLVLNQNDRSGLASLHYALEELEWNDQEGILAGVCDLNPPADLVKDDICPGSLFLLLEKTEQIDNYGGLELTDSRIIFNDVEVKNLESLITACLAVKNS
jgi:3-oxoacyl-[acyl-carrier-protein] synthase II